MYWHRFQINWDYKKKILISKRRMVFTFWTFYIYVHAGNKLKVETTHLCSRRGSSGIHNRDALRPTSRRPLLLYAPPWSIADCSRCLQRISAIFRHGRPCAEWLLTQQMRREHYRVVAKYGPPGHLNLPTCAAVTN
jgi:hypothetical protein